MMHQSTSQLTYCLIAAQTDLRPLKILDSRSLSWGDWSVAIHVLGASHAVEFRCGNGRLTELLTCVRPRLAGNTLISLRAEAPSEGCAKAQGLVCRVRLDPFRLRDNDDLDDQFDSECRLDVAFPGAGIAAPVTRIGWKLDANELYIQTVHSYPEEGRAVRSVSTFIREETDQ